MSASARVCTLRGAAAGAAAESKHRSRVLAQDEPRSSSLTVQEVAVDAAVSLVGRHEADLAVGVRDGLQRKFILRSPPASQRGVSGSWES
jgi:hypothetical protein